MRLWILLLLFFPGVAAAQQQPYTSDGSQVEQIGTLVAGVLGMFGFFWARWIRTNPERSIIQRLATVFDVSQIVDSTRKLDD